MKNALADPIRELRDEKGGPMMSIDNWKDDPQQADLQQAVDLAPTSISEAALFTRLVPGACTAMVRGKNGGSGVG